MRQKQNRKDPNQRKIIYRIAATLTAAILAVSIPQDNAAARMRAFVGYAGSTVETVEEVPEDVTTWKQGDKRWAKVPLGEQCTMASSGCLITAIAIQMRRAGAEDETFTPETLRDRLEAGGFVSHSAKSKAADGNLDYYTAFTSANSPGFYLCKTRDYSSSSFASICSDLQELLNNGYYCIVGVKNNCHWVAIREVSDGNAAIMDPSSKKPKEYLKDYKGGIVTCLIFKAAES